MKVITPCWPHLFPHHCCLRSRRCGLLALHLCRQMSHTVKSRRKKQHKKFVKYSQSNKYSQARASVCVCVCVFAQGHARIHAHILAHRKCCTFLSTPLEFLLRQALGKQFFVALSKLFSRLLSKPKPRASVTRSLIDV